MDIYVINLDRRPDRWREISDHLASLGLSCLRVAAVDASTLEATGDTFIDKGSDACWRSHRCVLAKIAAGSANNALILEGDALLDNSVDWPALLEQLDRYLLRSSIDVLQLGYVERYFESALHRFIVETGSGLFMLLRRMFAAVFRSHPTAEDRRWHGVPDDSPAGMLWVRDSFFGGTHCYVVSRRAANILQHLNMPTFLPADDFYCVLAHSASHYINLRVARVRRSLASQRRYVKGRSTDSDLDHHADHFMARSDDRQ